MVYESDGLMVTGFVVKPKAKEITLVSSTIEEE